MLGAEVPLLLMLGSMRLHFGTNDSVHHNM
jgi:hypothetical protein